MRIVFTVLKKICSRKYERIVYKKYRDALQASSNDSQPLYLTFSNTTTICLHGIYCSSNRGTELRNLTNYHLPPILHFSLVHLLQDYFFDAMFGEFFEFVRKPAGQAGIVQEIL